MELPEGLLASAVPAWRSSEVADRCGLCLAGLLAAGGLSDVGVPPDAVEQLRTVIDDGSEGGDADQLAAALLDYIRENWDRRR